LIDELGVDPDPATNALHAAILRDEPLPNLVIGPPRPSVTAPRREPALPGRAAELGVLDQAFARSASHGVEIIVVEGEGGIGKTALLSFFAAKCTAAGAAVLHGQCDELGRALPLQPVLDALSDYLRLAGQEHTD